MLFRSDARRDIDPALQAAMKERYLTARGISHVDAFNAAYAILGAQRHAKVIGIFTRLDRRDGKPVYLKHIARVWGLLEKNLQHPVLSGLRAWMDEHIPRHLRSAP